MSKTSPHLKRYTVTLSGHRTSISLEPLFWQRLTELASEAGTDMSTLVADIDQKRQGNLSSAIRLFVLQDALSKKSQD